MTRNYFRHVGAAALAASLPTAVCAEPWVKVADLPGDIAVELDQATVAHELDGERQVTTGVFRKKLPVATMETSVAADCQANEAKIRRVRLLNGEDVMSDSIMTTTTTFGPVNEGSAEAIYFAALCNAPAPASANAPAAPDAPATPDATPSAPTGNAGGQ